MHVELPGQILFTFVKTANAITSASDLRPILRNVLLVASDEGLEILATDMVVSLWLQIPLSDGVTVKKTGRCVVNAANLKGILDTLKKRDVVLKADEKRLIVSSGKGKSRAKFQSVVEDARDFPSLKRFDPSEPFEQVIGKDLVGLISRTTFCAHGERSHYLMHGLLLRAKDGEMICAATDGRRLAVSKAPFIKQGDEAEEPYDAEVVVPAALASNMNRVIGDATQSVDVQWLDRGMSVRGYRGEVTIHALNGSFPAFERGIRQNTKIITLNRREFMEILRQTSVFKSAATAFVDLILEDGRMIFRSLVQGAGQTEIVAELEWPHETLNLVVNPDFLADAAKAIRGDEIQFEVEDDRTPTMIREIATEGVSAFYVFSVARK